MMYGVFFSSHYKTFYLASEKPLKQSRRDYILVSSGLLNIVTTATITPGYRSDHSMINPSFRLGQMVTGKGFWKFNNFLLEDEAYQNLKRMSLMKLLLSMLVCRIILVNCLVYLEIL